MSKLMIAGVLAATLGASAQAAPISADRAWIDRMTFAVNDALSQSPETTPAVGVVYVPVTVAADGAAKVEPPVQSCGCPELDQAAFDALKGMNHAPRPPADLAGKRIVVRAVFAAAPTHGDLSQAAYRHCG